MEKLRPPVFFIILFLLADILTGNAYTFLIAPHSLQKTTRVKSDIFHHGLKPGVDTTLKWGKYTFHMVTNSLGFRDFNAREISLKKTPGVRRLLFIGDSFTEGIGVDYEEAFVGRIARQLSGKGIEVLNAGVVSYSPVLYQRKLQYFIGQQGLEVDEVVVFLDNSDIMNEVEYEAELNEPRPVQHRRRSWLEFLERNSVTCRLLLKIKWIVLDQPRIQKIQNERNYNLSRWSYEEKAFNDYGREGLGLAEKRMNGLLAFLKQRNIPMILAVYPSREQLLKQTRNSLQEIFWKEWASKNGVKFLNYFPVFFNLGKPEDTAKRYYLKGDLHWNQEGHEIVAQYFLDQFLVADLGLAAARDNSSLG